MSMSIDEYLSAHGLTLRYFSRLCGCTPSRLTQIKRGARPSWELALRIEEATGGLVGREQWYPERKK
jgi:transcriptional regulator with XRE-family HTH domain